MALIWERSGDALYAEAEAPEGGYQFSLIVEQLAEGSWGWSVMREVAGVWRLTHAGTSCSAQDAMREAEETTT